MGQRCSRSIHSRHATQEVFAGGRLGRLVGTMGLPRRLYDGKATNVIRAVIGDRPIQPHCFKPGWNPLQIPDVDIQRVGDRQEFVAVAKR